MKRFLKSLAKTAIESLATVKYKGLNHKISPNDLMYQSSSVWYMHFGKAALERAILTLKKGGKKDVTSILDLPCGHGRELRFFKNKFPDAHIVACDIDRDGVDFCVSTFGVEGFYSNKEPNQISIPYKFDLIWCGSLLTHLDERYWPDFLKFFREHLNIGGILIFSTHGRFITEKFRTGEYVLGLQEQIKKQMFKDFEQTGFGYGNYSGQEDYGISLSSKEWVCKVITEIPGLRLADYVERGWFYQHDTVACVQEEY